MTSYLYLGGISGSGSVTNGYNYGNVSSNLSALESHTHIGGISGSGTANYVYNTGDVYSYYGSQTSATAPTTSTNAISQSTENQNAYVTDKAITVGPDKTEPNGTVLEDNYMKTEEFYEDLLPGSEQWTYNEGKYPTLDIPVLGFNESAEVIMTNTKQQFDIITDIGINQDGQRAGGTLSGSYNDKYIETPTSKAKFVETVEYGENSTEPIVITPDTGWAIKKVTINNEDFGFETFTNEQGICTIPAGYFQDVRKNYTITATFGRIEKLLTVTKTDPDGNPLEGAVFDIYEYDERTEPQNPVGDLVQDATEKEYDAIIPVANFVNYNTKYKFTKDAYGYHSGNYNRNNSTSGMYIPIDLTNETESYELTVNYTISSQKNYDYGVAAVTTSTSQISTSTTPNLFKVSGATTTDTATQTLEPGQLYYLHVIYYKNGSTHSNNDQLDINYITISRKVNKTFRFDVVDGKYVSTNNTKMGTKTYSTAYMPIDLTDCTGPCDVVVNYDKICSSSNASYGYLVLNDNPNSLSSTSGYFLRASITQSNATAKKTVEGGSMYYLHFIQENNLSYTDNTSVDKFVINSVTAKLNKDNFYQIENLVTNSRGQIKTELNYGTYQIVEKQAPDGYTLNTTPKIHVVGDGTNNNVTIVNQPKAKVTAHFYLDRTGPEYDVEPVVLAADETQYGDVGTKYMTRPKLEILDYKLLKENDDFVIPENATGEFAAQDTNVYYYYDREQATYNVHYLYDGIEDEDAKDTFTVEDGTVIKESDILAKDKDGYYLYTIENVPLEVLATNTSNDIYVKYVKMAYPYEVHYFYDGVEDESKAELDGVELFGEPVSEYKEKNIPGYKFDKARALDENGEEAELPLVIKSDVTKNIINVYYVKDSFNYQVRYFYAGVEDFNNAELYNTAVFGSEISEFTQKNKTGYVFDKARAVNDEGQEAELPLVIKAEESKNVINVYYKKANFAYTVEYYYDGVKDATKTISNSAEYESQITSVDVDTNKITGYKYEKTEGLPLTISATVSENVIKVYYVKDSFGYTVHYFYDGTEDESKKIENTALFGSVIESVPDKNITGYKHDHTDGLPLTISATASENVVNVYYVKDSFGYTVHYFYDGTEDESKKIENTAVFGSVIESVPDKNITGYKHDHTDGLPLTISATASENVVNVYYVKDSVGYTVHYFYD